MDTRRSFLGQLAIVAASFAILPSATTYERIWKVRRPEWVVNPDWVNAPYELQFGLLGPIGEVQKFGFVVFQKVTAKPYTPSEIERYKVGADGCFHRVPKFQEA